MAASALSFWPLQVHMGELTVRETFDFAARCMGTGTKKGTGPVCSADGEGGLHQFCSPLRMPAPASFSTLSETPGLLALPSKNSLNPAQTAYHRIIAAQMPRTHG